MVSPVHLCLRYHSLPQTMTVDMTYVDMSYENLLCHAKSTTLVVKRLRMMLYDTYRSLQKTHSDCLNDTFVIKEINYRLRHKVKLIQPKRNNTTYGLRSVSYVGTKLWNDNPIGIDNLGDLDQNSFIQMLEFINDHYIRNSTFQLV